MHFIIQSKDTQLCFTVPQIPRLALLVAPVKVLGRPQDFAVQTQGFGAMRGKGPGRRRLWDPDVWRHLELIGSERI